MKRNNEEYIDVSNTKTILHDIYIYRLSYSFLLINIVILLLFL